MTNKLDAVGEQTSSVKKTADELKVSRRRTWLSILFITVFTTLDVAATVIAITSLNTVHTLISTVTCPTDALYLRTYNPARAATYPGGLPAYMRDMHTIYEQYTVTLNCSPHVKDPTNGGHP